jgi:hypothetical protein
MGVIPTKSGDKTFFRQEKMSIHRRSTTLSIMTISLFWECNRASPNMTIDNK